MNSNKNLGFSEDILKAAFQVLHKNNNVPLTKVEAEIAERTHTVPKTAKEKSLAALATPKDKITHKDVMVGRGVIAKESEEHDQPVPPEQSSLFTDEELASIARAAK